MTPNGPAYVATPVMTAMVESPADLPSAAANAAVSPAAAQVRGDAATAPSAATTAPARTSESRPAALARADRRATAEPQPKPKAMAKPTPAARRSEEHTSELQSLMRISYAVFCLKKKKHSPNHKYRYSRPTEDLYHAHKQT